MPTKTSLTNDRINNAVEAAKKHPTLSVPETMFLGGFSRKQISVDAAEHGRNLHHQVYKRVGKSQDTRRVPRAAMVDEGTVWLCPFEIP